MKYRKLHVNDGVWEYFVGKRLIDIKSPDGKRTQVAKAEIFMDNEETAKKRTEGDEKWWYHRWDYPSVVPSDFGIELTSSYPPSVIKRYIEVKLLKNI